MAITVISRPLGHKLDTESHSATIVDDGTGTAVVYVPGGHNLTDGDWVYIESNFDRYNGYKYVDSTAYDYFQIKNSASEAAIEFIQEADITFYISVLDHGWCAVHLPIVYELESSLYPNNTEEEDYTPRTVVSQSNNDGYTQLNLSSALGASADVKALEWIELVGDGVLEGAYQIIEVLQPWSIVIDLAYSASNDFSGYQVVNYYNNYHVKVRVYAGLTTGHRWVDEKPYELADTLELIPDSSNRIKFSIATILQGYIETRNNLTLDTLPNNLDFYVQFYISYSENYDTSDGTTITVSEGAFSSDQGNFEGHAVNAKMPFKSIDAGFMSEYVDNGENNAAAWLTLMDRPTMFIGYFFDISFINQYSAATIHIVIFKSLNGIVTETETIVMENPGTGIIRVPITVESGFDQYCIQASIPGAFTPATLPALSTWSNLNDAGPAWTLVSNIPQADTNDLGGGITSDKWLTSYSFEAGRTYQFSYSFDPVGSLTKIYRISILDSSNVVLTSTSVTVSGGVITSGVYTVVAPAGAAKISIHFTQSGSCGSPSGGCLVKILSFENITQTIEGGEITQQICCDVVDPCNTYGQ